MHRQWRRLTKSKNAILIDGRGQYAGADKSLQIQSTGRVLEAREDKRRQRLHQPRPDRRPTASRCPT